MINLADDSESDSSYVDIVGCDFYQNIKKYEKKSNNNKQTNKREEKCV